jgi:protein phosphatase 1K
LILRRTVNVVAVFDGHGGRESSEMGSKLLLDYLHVVFLPCKLMGKHKGELL